MHKLITKLGAMYKKNANFCVGGLNDSTGGIRNLFSSYWEFEKKLFFSELSFLDVNVENVLAYGFPGSLFLCFSINQSVLSVAGGFFPTYFQHLFLDSCELSTTGGLSPQVNTF